MHKIYTLCLVNNYQMYLWYTMYNVIYYNNNMLFSDINDLLFLNFIHIGYRVCSLYPFIKRTVYPTFDDSVKKWYAEIDAHRGQTVHVQSSGRTWISHYWEILKLSLKESGKVCGHENLDGPSVITSRGTLITGYSVISDYCYRQKYISTYHRKWGTYISNNISFNLECTSPTFFYITGSPLFIDP